MIDGLTSSQLSMKYTTQDSKLISCDTNIKNCQDGGPAITGVGISIEFLFQELSLSRLRYGQYDQIQINFMSHIQYSE